MTLSCDFKVRVGVPRLERGTSVLSGLRSNQLSYTPCVAEFFIVSQSR